MHEYGQDKTQAAPTQQSVYNNNQNWDNMGINMKHMFYLLSTLVLVVLMKYCVTIHQFSILLHTNSKIISFTDFWSS